VKHSLFLFAVLLMIGCQKKTNEEIFVQIANDLQQIEQIQYDFTFEQKGFDSADSNYSYSGTQALDFTKKNQLGADVYSKRLPRPGKEGFERLAIGDSLIRIFPKTKTVVKDPNAGSDFIAGNVVLYFNIYDLRKSLPLVLKDSTTSSLKITDTMLNNTPSVSIEFKIKKAILAGNLYDTKGKENTYNLVVRKGDHVPISWGYKTQDGGDVRFRYKNIQTSIDPSLWNYNATQEYTAISGDEYRLRQKNDLNKQLGNDFPDWQLSSIRGKSLSNENFKNRVTLYEFFFVGCIGSIKSKPFIKKLEETYRGKLNIVNVEIQDNVQKDVLSFVEKYDLQEPVVYGGKALADQLGVLGCPTYVLVDKSGKIIFSSFGDTTGLEERLQNEL